MKWGNNSTRFQFLDIILHSITLDNILLKNPLKNGCLLGILLNDTECKRFRLKPGFKKDNAVEQLPEGCLPCRGTVDVIATSSTSENDIFCRLSTRNITANIENGEGEEMAQEGREN